MFLGKSLEESAMIKIEVPKIRKEIEFLSVRTRIVLRGECEVISRSFFEGEGDIRSNLIGYDRTPGREFEVMTAGDKSLFVANSIEDPCENYSKRVVLGEGYTLHIGEKMRKKSLEVKPGYSIRVKLLDFGDFESMRPSIVEVEIDLDN